MDLDTFQVSAVSDAPQKIIGAFFGKASDYFMLRPKGRDQFYREFSLGAFDEDLKALHKLAVSAPSERVDDRRFCIEIQSGSDVSLLHNKLLAVICPSIYLDDKDFRHHVEAVWKAEPISYNWYSLNYHNYIGQIYEKVLDFYVQNAYIMS
jgi:hypothetical protein